MTKSIITLAKLCLLFNLNPFVKADQPVHCLRESMFGVWNFHVTKDVDNVNLFTTSEVCSHELPNKIQLVSSAHEFTFGSEDIYRLNIMENYRFR